jgi:hypothetical protein
MLERLFGCSHRRTTFPMRPPSRVVVPTDGSRRCDYIVCLDCGREFSYDWNAMRLESRAVSIFLGLARQFRQMNNRTSPPLRLAR